ncbi:MAG: DUF4139 domain-containing protein [Planctomycetes bacterium]|nr:DUF4139 domain-containing protein [Planctomycetota bacterium]
MRRWCLYSSGLVSLGLLAAFGPMLFSGAPKDAGKDAAAAAPKIAMSKIARVTVYPNSALVTREVVVPDGAGLVELVVPAMPNQIVASTMYSEAGNGVRVLTTRLRTRQVLEDTSEERRKLEAEMEKLMVTAAKIDSDIQSCDKNMMLLNKLENFTDKSTVLSTEKGGLNGDAVITMAKYVMEQRGEKTKELVGYKEQKRQNDIQMSFCKRKMGELGQGSGREERDAIIVVDRADGKGGTLRLNYLVGSVTWRPEYKLRAGKGKEDVQLDYLANLKQHSGEDWNHVKLTLSTAQPLLNAAPPELAVLEPILVARGGPGGPPMPTAGMPSPDAFAVPGAAARDLESKANSRRSQASANYRSGESKAAAEAAKQLNDASAQEQQLDLMRSRDDILAMQKKKAAAPMAGNDGPSVTYHLTSNLSVPSRNDEQIVEVAKLNLAPRYYYKTVPVLNRNVYKLADIVNRSSHILLPGEATMYQGTDFVGRMVLPLVAVGEEFTAGFGVDTQLQVQRELVDKSKSTQGGNQVLKYEYRMLISSYKSEPVKLQVWDRLLHADSERVNITLVKTSPELSKDGIYLRESRPKNLLRWDMEVEANRNGENAVPITYEFRMELDRQMAIKGFQSR